MDEVLAAELRSLPPGRVRQNDAFNAVHDHPFPKSLRTRTFTQAVYALTGDVYLPADREKLLEKIEGTFSDRLPFILCAS